MTESTAIWGSRWTNRRLYTIKKSNCSSCQHGFVSLFTGHTTTNQKSGIGRGLEMEDIDWILYFCRRRTRVFLRSIYTVLQTGSIGLPASSSMPPTHDHLMSAEISTYWWRWEIDFEDDMAEGLNIQTHILFVWVCDNVWTVNCIGPQSLHHK